MSETTKRGRNILALANYGTFGTLTLLVEHLACKKSCTSNPCRVLLMGVFWGPGLTLSDFCKTWLFKQTPKVVSTTDHSAVCVSVW